MTDKPITPELRSLADWGRRMKNEKLRGGGGDLIPQVELIRDGQMIASVFIIGDRDDAFETLHGAIVGYGADELKMLNDAFSFSVSVEEFERSSYRPGQLAELFNSPDPAERALVSESLFITHYKRTDDGVACDFVVVPYAFDPKKNKFRWSRLRSSEDPGGDLHDLVIHALGSGSAFEFIVETLGESPEGVDPQTTVDITVTRLLVERGCPVLYACRDEKTSELLNEALRDLPGFSVRKVW